MTIHLNDLQSQNSFELSRPGRPSNVFYRSFVKRAIDVVLVLLAAPVVLTVVLILAFFIALDGHNPFYSQMRIGKNGKHFRIWKLRSMVWDADVQLQKYLETNPKAKREWDATQKLRSDPRITRIGHIIRKSSIDELPQLWNVLTGAMSLIGPRPMMVQQQSQYIGQTYYEMLPGITGLWQISDRNNCDFVDRVGYDDKYYASVSFKEDLRILTKTVGVVLRGTGC